MQRDMDLVRKILSEIEKMPLDGGRRDLAIEGYSQDEITYHVKIMHDAGLVEAFNLSTMGGTHWRPTSLTWEGHEFLDNARNETVWAKTREIVKDKGGSASFDVLKELMIKVAMQIFIGS